MKRIKTQCRHEHKIFYNNPLKTKEFKYANNN